MVTEMEQVEGRNTKMKAFSVLKKSGLYQVLKVCSDLAKERRNHAIYSSIYYNAETNEIIATNGFNLLIYKTNIIEKELGKTGNGIIRLVGEYAIFEDIKDIPLNYKTVTEGFKATKKLQIDSFFGHLSTPAGIAIMSLALNGITMGFNAVKCFNTLNEYEYVEINDGEHPVRFVGQDGNLVLYVMPYKVFGGWKEV